MAGLPQQEIDLLDHIDKKLAKIIARLDALPPVDLAAIVAAQTETNRLLGLIILALTPQKATTLGGSVQEVPNPPPPPSGT